MTVRIPAVRRADQIVVLDRGRVNECGTFDELMRNKDSLLRRIVDRQTFKWDEN